MSIVRPPYAMEREAPTIRSGSISTLAIPADEAAVIVKHPIGFVPISPATKPKRKPRKKTGPRKKGAA